MDNIFKDYYMLENIMLEIYSSRNNNERLISHAKKLNYYVEEVKEKGIADLLMLINDKSINIESFLRYEADNMLLKDDFYLIKVDLLIDILSKLKPKNYLNIISTLIDVLSDIFKKKSTSYDFERVVYFYAKAMEILMYDEGIEDFKLVSRIKEVCQTIPTEDGEWGGYNDHIIKGVTVLSQCKSLECFEGLKELLSIKNDFLNKEVKSAIEKVYIKRGLVDANYKWIGKR